MFGSGRVFKRGNRWWIAYYSWGREYRESSRSTSRADAERLLKHRLREVGSDTLGYSTFIPPSRNDLTVGALLRDLEQDYRRKGGRALPQFLAHIRAVCRAFGDRRAVALTELEVDRYIQDRLAARKAPGTVNRELQLLGQAFRLAVRKRRLRAIPLIPRLPERNVRQGFFERDEFAAVVQHLPDYLQDFARFAYFTGWRKGEIRSLTWADVDLEEKVVRLNPLYSKSGVGRVLPLEGELWEIIRRRREQAVSGSSYVFCRDGRPLVNIRRAWILACKGAGVQGKLFHDLRRTAVRNMVRAGVPERVVMEVVGHKTRSIFDRYNIVNLTDLRRAMRWNQGDGCGTSLCRYCWS